MSIEEKYDEVRQLINIGKEKGYLLYDEVNELLPSEITSSEELDDLFNTFGSAGIEVIDSDQKYLRDDKPIDRTGEGTAPVVGPGDLSECARILKRLRCERERAALQREIDRLQGLGLGSHGEEINLLLNQKRTLAQRIEELT